MEIAALTARVNDLAQDIRAFGPTVGTVAQHEARIEGLEDDVKETRNEVREMRKGRRDVMLALVALVGTLGSALIAGAVALIIHFAGGG